MTVIGIYCDKLRVLSFQCLGIEKSAQSAILRASVKLIIPNLIAILSAINLTFTPPFLSLIKLTYYVPIALYIKIPLH